MSIIIVGAGEIGINLVDIAIRDNNEVVVIEGDSAQAERVRRTFDCKIVNDEPASIETLRRAGGDFADALIASSGSDEINLMVSLLAQELGIGEIVSLINDMEHKSLFQRFSIHTIENPYELVADYFYASALHPSIIKRHRFSGTTEILEFEVSESASIAGHSIAEASAAGYLSDDVTVIAIQRGGPAQEQIIPKGETDIETADKVTLIAPSHTIGEVADVFD